MKRNLLLYLLLISTVTNYARVIDADTLIIRFLTWNVGDVPHFTTCINYESEVPFHEYKITDTSAIDILNNEIDCLKKTQEQDFCVACKLLCVKNGIVNNVLCMNTKYIMINGNVYLCDKSIVNTIDTLMNRITLSTERFNYVPEKFGGDYCKGREELYNILSIYYRKLGIKYNISGPTKIEISCKANKKGKTKVVNVRLHNKGINREDKIKIEESINKWFLRKIRWKKNNTRMKADWIKVYYDPSKTELFIL